MTHDSMLSKGKYKFWRLGDIPPEYLLAIWTSGSCWENKELGEYIKENLEEIKTRVAKPAPPLVPFICDKKTFPTKKDALNSLNRIRQDDKSNMKPQRAYECEKCSGWHLTSMPIEVFNSIPKQADIYKRL